MVSEDYNEKMEDLYFDFQAEIGITKHMGTLAATNRLIKKVQVNPQSVVLDIGCGAGFTAVFFENSAWQYFRRDYSVH